MSFISRRLIGRVAAAFLPGFTVAVDALRPSVRNGEPTWIEVTHLDLKLPRLDPAFEGYRIVQVSDIHADTRWMDAERIEQIVKLTNAQRPDAIVITGDFVTIYSPEAISALTALRHLQASDGIFAVLGNHDHYVGGAKHIRKLIKDCGFVELNDCVYTLRRQESLLHLIGMDDLLKVRYYASPMEEGKRKLDMLLQTLPDEGAAILLVHEPDFAVVAAATKRIALQLSGHTHGGQVRIPFYGTPPSILPNLGQIYVSGLYRIGSMYHYTNRGLAFPHIRFNCRPEITVIVCHAK